MKKFILYIFSILSICSLQIQAQCSRNDMIEDIPNSDFIINDSTVTHTLTNIMWDRCSIGTSWNNITKQCDGVISVYTWQEALQEVQTRNEDNYLGFSDWRLPNIKELSSILETCAHPAFNNDIFPPGADGGRTYQIHWSSTIDTNTANGNAFYINFSLGRMVTKDITNSFFIRLARSGGQYDSFDGLKYVPSDEPENDDYAFIVPIRLLLLN